MLSNWFFKMGRQKTLDVVPKCQKMFSFVEVAHVGVERDSTPNTQRTIQKVMKMKEKRKRATRTKTTRTRTTRKERRRRTPTTTKLYNLFPGNN